jgi:hypothetical protein
MKAGLINDIHPAISAVSNGVIVMSFFSLASMAGRSNTAGVTIKLFNRKSTVMTAINVGFWRLKICCATNHSTWLMYKPVMQWLSLYPLNISAINQLKQCVKMAVSMA